MTEGIDEPFAQTALTDSLLNTVTIGQSPTFPETYPASRLLYHTGLDALYHNNGTLNDPIWRRYDNTTGTITMYAGQPDTIPQGKLLCDGSQVAKITYPELYAVLGTTYGAETATHFTLPNLTQRFPRGNNQPGRTGGEDAHVLTEAEMPNHDHPLKQIIKTYPAATQGARMRRTAFLPNTEDVPTELGEIARGDGEPLTTETETSIYQDAYGTTPQGNDDAHENKPPFINLLFLIAI